MPDIHWIKMATAMWEDEKVTVLSSRSDGDSIMMVWCRLLCLAGKCNDCGRIYLAPGIAYSDETLANVFHRPASLIRQSLKAFSDLGMVTLHGNGVIELNNWDKYQNTDGMSRIRELTRIRVQKSRERRKMIGCNATVTLRNAIDSDSDSENKKKTERPKKQPVEKVQHAEEVTLTPDEYSSLCQEHREEIVLAAIQVLSAYKVSKGKAYKSDAGALRSWAIKRALADADSERERKLRLARYDPKAAPKPVEDPEIAARRKAIEIGRGTWRSS